MNKERLKKYLERTNTAEEYMENWPHTFDYLAMGASSIPILGAPVIAGSVAYVLTSDEISEKLGVKQAAEQNVIYGTIFNIITTVVAIILIS